MSDIAAPAGPKNPDPKALQPTLQRALDALNRNEFVAAEMALDEILSSFPDEPNALQLLGLVRRAQARPAEAEALYRRSLEAQPAQPNVHYNLGNLLLLLGRAREAAEALREAIRHKPNYTEAHYQLGQALQRLDDFAGAEKSYRTALRIQPNFIFAMQGLAVTLSAQERTQEAIDLLRRALTLSVKNPRQTAALEHNLGVALRKIERYDEALVLFDRAQAAVPDIPMADYNRALTLEQMNRIDEAIACYRQALMREPLNTSAHRDLNHLLYRMNRNAEFLKSFDEAVLMYPEASALVVDKAAFQFFTGRIEEAQEGYARAADLAPDHVSPLIGLGLCAARLGDFGAAIDWHEKAMRLEPDNSHAWCNFSETLLRAREFARAAKTAEEALAIEPENQYALGLLGLALRGANDAREERLNDYDAFVQVFDLEPPAGYADMESFNGDLNAWLDHRHRDKREVLNQTLRGGTQTFDNLFGRGHELVNRLEARIQEAVATYIARMREDEDHPLLSRRRNAFKYSGSWSSRLADCGFHTNHVHPKGWISSAYYIAVPDVAADASKKEGWIKFGEPDFDAGFADPVRRAIQPKPGRLVLFPSYMWHGTVPFHAPTARTTVAFDAVPK